MTPLTYVLTLQSAIEEGGKFHAGISILVFISITTWFSLNVIIGTFTSIFALGFQLKPHRVLRLIYFIIILLLLIVYIWFFTITSTTILTSG